jgi:hypothetical protein
MNWRLVANPLKHGMMTIGPNKGTAGIAIGGGEMGAMAMDGINKPFSVAIMAVLSFVALAAGLALAFAG